ncbi:MAG: hypothetical protein ACC653_02180 [Gammaproteobacteria bacterium]
MKHINFLQKIGILSLLLLLASCASTSVTGSWKDASYNKPAKHILVVAFAKKEASRRIFEDTLTKDLIKAGVKADISVKFFPEVNKINKKTLAPIVKKENYDMVFVARVISVDKETRYVPSGYPSNYYSMYGYSGYASSYYRDPGYTVQDTIVSLEFNLYETSGAKLIWALTTETFQPDKINKEIASLSEIIIKKLKEDKFI